MNTSTKRLHSCAQLVQGEFDDRIKCILIEDQENENYVEGLCFDYVEPKTWDDQLEGYWRWQLSWGGPGDEFRLFVNPDMSLHRAEYWYLDWYDGAHVTLDAKLHADAWAKLEGMLEGRSCLHSQS